VMERERRAFEFRLSELKGEKEAAEQARDYALKHTVRHDNSTVYTSYLSSMLMRRRWSRRPWTCALRCCRSAPPAPSSQC
jgi:hypothetical protein